MLKFEAYVHLVKDTGETRSFNGYDHRIFEAEVCGLRILTMIPSSMITEGEGFVEGCYFFTETAVVTNYENKFIPKKLVIRVGSGEIVDKATYDENSAALKVRINGKILKPKGREVTKFGVEATDFYKCYLVVRNESQKTFCVRAVAFDKRAVNLAKLEDSTFMNVEGTLRLRNSDNLCELKVSNFTLA